MASQPPQTLASLIRAGDTASLKALLRSGADIEARDGRQCTALWLAADTGNVEVMHMLLRHPQAPQVDAVNVDGESPLYAASRKGHVDAIELLLGHGANINHTANSGATALITAAYHGKLDAVILLADRGARLDAATANGITALTIAKQMRHDSIYAYLKVKLEAMRQTRTKEQLLRQQQQQQQTLEQSLDSSAGRAGLGGLGGAAGRLSMRNDESGRNSPRLAKPPVPKLALDSSVTLQDKIAAAISSQMTPRTAAAVMDAAAAQSPRALPLFETALKRHAGAAVRAAVIQRKEDKRFWRNEELPDLDPSWSVVRQPAPPPHALPQTPSTDASLRRPLLERTDSGFSEDGTFVPPHRRAESHPVQADATLTGAGEAVEAPVADQQHEGEDIPEEAGTFVPSHRRAAGPGPVVAGNAPGNGIGGGDPAELYTALVRLDAGASGEVFKGIRVADGKEVAIKKINFKSEADLKKLENEIHMMRLACHTSVTAHANVIHFYDSHLYNSQMWIVMEFMSGGKLTTLLKSMYRLYVDEKVIAYFLLEIIKGLKYLHTQNIIHRDIKSDNILVSHNGAVKLGDLGLSAAVLPGAQRTTILGTPFWMAPEVIKGVPYDCKADIWSLGMLALELAEGDPPYINMAPFQALQAIISQPPPHLKDEAKWSPEFVHFVDIMLQQDPGCRPLCSDLLKHTFLERSCEAPFVARLISKACS